MQLSRQAKFLFLFFSPNNPLWTDLLEPPITHQRIAKASHVSQSTITNWKRGGREIKINLANVRDSLSELSADIEDLDKAGPWDKATPKDQAVLKRHLEPARKLAALNLISAFLTKCCSDSGTTVSVYDVATEILSLTMKQAQTILDEIIFEEFTLFPPLCYETQLEAEKDFRQFGESETRLSARSGDFGGLYLLYVRRADLWLKCPLRVRYVLSLSGKYLIRCKLNAPMIHEDTRPRPYWEYDGFLRVLDKKVFWKFAKREDRGTDFFDFITYEGITEPRSKTALIRMLTGVYLTIGQDPLQSIEHSDVLLKGILLEELKTKDDTRTDEQIVQHWMHHTGDVLSKDDNDTKEEWTSVRMLGKKLGLAL
jgi:hypothetical protein